MRFGRVNGVLALSRAIGDFAFKNPEHAIEEQCVTCIPDITKTDRQPGADEFILIACDGLWDVRTTE